MCFIISKYENVRNTTLERNFAGVRIISEDILRRKVLLLTLPKKTGSGLGKERVE